MAEVDEAFEAYQARPDVEPLADRREREAGAAKRALGVSEDAVEEAEVSEESAEGAEA